MPAYFSFRNECAEYYRSTGASPFALNPGTTILAGSLDNLVSRQLGKKITLGPEGSGKCSIYAGVPDYNDGSGGVGLSQVRVIAVLGLVLPNYDEPMYGDGNIVVSGQTPAGAWEVVAQQPLARSYIHTRQKKINIFFVAPWGDVYENFNPITYRQYRFDFWNTDDVLGPQPVSFGGIWIGNAVEFSDGVDAQWISGAFDYGALSAARDGSAYASPGEVVRELRVSCSKLEEADAIGVGRGLDDLNRENAANWLTDASETLGTTGPCILIPRSASQTATRLGIYGHLTRPIEITHRAGPYYSCEIAVREER